MCLAGVRATIEASTNNVAAFKFLSQSTTTPRKRQEGIRTDPKTAGRADSKVDLSVSDAPQSAKSTLITFTTTTHTYEDATATALSLYRRKIFSSSILSFSPTHNIYTMSFAAGVPKTFWSNPVRYLRWASHEKPAIFWSVLVGCLGPVTLLVVPPMRRYVGDENPPKVPLSYPVPKGPRKKLDGFEDPE